jgi:hypothetical protein
MIAGNVARSMPPILAVISSTLFASSLPPKIPNLAISGKLTPNRLSAQSKVFYEAMRVWRQLKLPVMIIGAH